MNAKEFKEWINSLPEEFNEFEITYREYGDFVDDQYYVNDASIDATMIDKNTHNLVFMSEESYECFINKV